MYFKFVDKVSKIKNNKTINIENIRFLASTICFFAESCPHIGSNQGCESCFRFLMNLKQIRLNKHI